MGFLIYTVLAVLFGVGVLKLLLHTFPLKGQTHAEPQYRKRPFVMNQGEAAFFHELRKQLPIEYHIFPKMRIADILETTAHGRDYYIQRNKILPKHVDFLICDAHLHPVMALELNGGSHDRAERAASDTFKVAAFTAAALPLEVVKVGQHFEEQIKSLLMKLK